MMTDQPESLAAALAQFQANLPQIAKTETAGRDGGKKWKYADLAEVARQVLPRLGELGLAFTACPRLNADGQFVLAYALTHASGGSLEGEWPLPKSGTAQDMGSAITYARRYALCSVTGVAADEDDDGAAATAAKPARPAKQARKATVAPYVEDDMGAEDVDVAFRSTEEAAAEAADLTDAYQAEIESARSQAELADVGRRSLVMRDRKVITDAQWDRLARAAAARRAELDQGVSV